MNHETHERHEKFEDSKMMDRKKTQRTQRPIRVVHRKGVEWAEEQVQDVLDDFTKKLGRMFK